MRGFLRKQREEWEFAVVDLVTDRTMVRRTLVSSDGSFEAAASGNAGKILGWLRDYRAPMTWRLDNFPMRWNNAQYDIQITSGDAGRSLFLKRALMTRNDVRRKLLSRFDLSQKVRVLGFIPGKEDDHIAVLVIQGDTIQIVLPSGI